MTTCSYARTLLVLALCGASVASAATYTSVTDTQLAQRSPVIVLAEPIGESSRLAYFAGSLLPSTDTTFRVIETFKGSVPQTFSVGVPGGTAGDLEWYVFGRPEFNIGDPVILFLSPHRNGKYSLTEFGLSKFDVTVDERGKEFAGRFLWGTGEHRIGTAVPGDYLRPLEPFLEGLRALKARGTLPAFPTAAPRGLIRRRGGPPKPGQFSTQWVNIALPDRTRWFWDTNASPAGKVNIIGKQTNLKDGSDGVDLAKNAIATWTQVPNSEVRYSEGTAAESNINLHLNVESTIEFGSSAWTQPFDCINNRGVMGIGGPTRRSSSTGTYKGHDYSIITGGIALIRKDVCANGLPPDLFKHVVTHELGHVLGLGHPHEAESPESTTGRIDWKTGVMAGGAGALSGLAKDDVRAVQYYYGTYSTPFPVITAISPATAPSPGGTTVSISGAHFVSGVEVVIGGQYASGVRLVDSGTITATVTPGNPGDAKVAVSNPNGQGAVLLGAFKYTGPVITSATPREGSVTGGAEVTLRGDGFVSGATVWFGEQPVTAIVDSPSTVRVRAPAYAMAARVPIEVQNPDGGIGNLTTGFQFLPVFDPNGDSATSSSDVFRILAVAKGRTSGSIPSLDSNGDGTVAVADADYLVEHLFGFGPGPLAAPSASLYVNSGDSRLMSVKALGGEPLTLFSDKMWTSSAGASLSLRRGASAAVSDTVLFDPQGRPVTVLLRDGSQVHYGYAYEAGLWRLRYSEVRLSTGGVVSATPEGAVSALTPVTHFSAAAAGVAASHIASADVTPDSTPSVSGSVFVRQSCGNGVVLVDGATVTGDIYYYQTSLCPTLSFTAKSFGGNPYLFDAAFQPTPLVDDIAVAGCQKVLDLTDPMCSSGGLNTPGVRQLRLDAIKACAAMVWVPVYGPAAAVCASGFATWEGLCQLNQICENVQNVGRAVQLVDAGRAACITQSPARVQVIASHPSRGWSATIKEFEAGTTGYHLDIDLPKTSRGSNVSPMSGRWYLPAVYPNTDLSVKIEDDGCQIKVQVWWQCSSYYGYCHSDATIFASSGFHTATFPISDADDNVLSGIVTYTYLNTVSGKLQNDSYPILVRLEGDRLYYEPGEVEESGGRISQYKSQYLTRFTGVINTSAIPATNLKRE